MENSKPVTITAPYAITLAVSNAQVTWWPERLTILELRCLVDNSSISVPITQASVSLLPSPQQRVLEAQATKDAQEIKELKAKLVTSQRAAEDWRRHSDKLLAEVKRLEAACGTQWEAKNKAEREYKELVGELHDAKNQLRDVRVANRKLVDKTKELEKHSKTIENIANMLSSEKSSLRLQLQEAQAMVRELETTGSAKERDIYSKALEQKDVQISQITKQAKEWKETATTRAKEIDRLSELVLVRTKGRDALQAEKGFHYAGTTTQTPATVSLNTRLTAVEARVEKLEEAEGFPMESYTAPKWQPTMLYMGNLWVKGFLGDSGKYYSVRNPDSNKEREWDLANQPTRWKPMTK